ncbi:hypothetical protein HUO09_17900 [Vibrio sp. Y2-5]|uniref:hypothetical protein n=1 Tax=Vibrio sp. Y2-5 TaxID=2743977 RepID=UPI001661484C|nr:hypothetical protein [Vibrio sp. Y2-5]MBD0788233.1 hypothetical protein [Vibrio sp. Y2-5]
MNTSHLRFPSGRSVSRVKQDATALKKQRNISKTEALNECAVINGISLPWDKAVELLKAHELAQSQSITISLHSLLPDDPEPELADFVRPELSLTGQRGVGLIYGRAGTGKSILASSIMEEALKQGFSIDYLDGFGFSYFLEKQIKHPDDMALNELARLSHVYPGKITLIDNERRTNFKLRTLPEPSAQTLLVIDELSIQLEGGLLGTSSDDVDKRFAKYIQDYVAEGGLILLVDQDSNLFERLIVNEKSIGFAAVAGMCWSSDFTLIKKPTALDNLINRIGRYAYPFVCVNPNGMSIGSLRRS